MKNKILRFELSIIIALIISFTFNVVSFSQKCDNIRDKMLRMHVIANSDSREDQELKLKVRDAVLNEGREIFNGSITSKDAEEKIIPNIKRLENVAKDVINKNGYNYDVNIVVRNEYFKTRTYNNQITLPAGNYMAVKVIIGEGKGKNWWCVMFPPMCLPSVNEDCTIDDVLNADEVELVKGTEKYKFKFKIVEIFKEVFKNDK